MAQREAQNGFEYEYLFTYADEQNTPIYWKIRLKNHNTGDKWIRIFSEGQRGFVTKEPDFNAVYPVGNGKKPLYALAQIGTPQKMQKYGYLSEQKANLAAIRRYCVHVWRKWQRSSNLPTAISG